GAYVALVLAVRKMLAAGLTTENPVFQSVAAVSLGIVGGRILVDLNYAEDSTADVDLNLVMTGDKRLVEVQGTGERATFDQQQLSEMLALGQNAIATLTALQSTALA
ncbi:MAG: ribonuclease PH, partial [Verrucomicrobiia bacterium]